MIPEESHKNLPHMKLNQTLYKGSHTNRNLSNVIERPSIKIDNGHIESPNLRTRLAMAHQTLYSPQNERKLAKGGQNS